MNLSSVIFYLLSFLFVILYSCGSKEEDCPVPVSDQPANPVILGSYTGHFKFENAPELIEDEDRIMVIGEDIFSADGRDYTVATLESFVYIIKLDNLTAVNGKVNGKVYLYNEMSDINTPGKHIAGDGSFNYTDGKVTILWTADPVNNGWSLAYQGE